MLIDFKMFLTGRFPRKPSLKLSKKISKSPQTCYLVKYENPVLLHFKIIAEK